MITLKKPIIGLIGRLERKEFDSIFIHDEYRVAILNSGGIPFLLMPTYLSEMKNRNAFQNDFDIQSQMTLKPLLEICDGFLFSGGSEWFGFDEYILKYAYQTDKPVLGICLGMQLMANVPYFHETNSDKTQKIVSKINHQSKEKYVHVIHILKSKLKEILDSESIFVNSRHSSCVLKNDFFKVSSHSLDGVIESIEIPDRKFMIGVQWHPEILFSKDIYSQRLFRAFIEACKKN